MGKRKIEEDENSAYLVLSQQSRKIRLNFEASKEARRWQLAEDLYQTVGDEDEFFVFTENKNIAEISPSHEIKALSSVSPSHTVIDEDMNDDDPKAISKNKVRKAANKSRKPSWRNRMAQLIGTYDSFLDIPEDLFECWNIRARPDGYRCLLVRNRREMVHIIGKGGRELWSLKNKLWKGDEASQRLSNLLRIPGNSVLEGIWDEKLQWFYVFDLLIWNSMDMINCGFQARHFFLKSRWEEFEMQEAVENWMCSAPIRLLLMEHFAVSVDSLSFLYNHISRCNSLSPKHAPVSENIDKMFNVISHSSLDFVSMRFDGIVFTHNESIYAPGINPFTLHWRHSDISIWIDRNYKRCPKCCLIFRSASNSLQTCDGTICEFGICTFPRGFEDSKKKDLLLRLSYARIDLKSRGEDTVACLSGVKLESWKEENETRISWRWNSADSFARLVLNMPVYDQAGNKVGTDPPDLESVIRRATMQV